MLYKENIIEFMNRLSMGEYFHEEWTTHRIRKNIGITGNEIYRLQQCGIIPRPRHEGRLCVWSNEELCAMLRRVLDFIVKYDLRLCVTTKYEKIMQGRITRIGSGVPAGLGNA